MKELGACTSGTEEQLVNEYVQVIDGRIWPRSGVLAMRWLSNIGDSGLQ